MDHAAAVNADAALDSPMLDSSSVEGTMKAQPKQLRFAQLNSENEIVNTSSSSSSVSTAAAAAGTANQTTFVNGRRAPLRIPPARRVKHGRPAGN